MNDMNDVPSHYTLPFCLQMNILSFSPRLPTLPPLFWKYMRSHYDRRMCSYCGRYLSMERKKFICLCHRRCGHRGKRKFWAFQFEDDLMNRNRCWKTHATPGILYKHHTINFADYVCNMLEYPDIIDDGNRSMRLGEEWYYVTSSQPMFLISFMHFCRLPWHRYKSSLMIENISIVLEELERRSLLYNYFHPNWLFHRVVNTNTLLRNFADTFHSQIEDKRGYYWYNTISSFQNDENDENDDEYYPGVRIFNAPFSRTPLSQNTGVISLNDFISMEYLNFHRPFIRDFVSSAHFFFHGKL